MSTHEIAIVEVGDVVPHPNPEVTKMELTTIWGWQCCIGKGQFKKGDKAIYIVPDYMVPLAHPSFAFLKNKNNEGKTQERIRVRRFKGTISQGLLISVPSELDHLPVGSNVIAELGIERYEPPMDKSTGGDFVGAPSGLYCPKFDVESYQRFNTIFVPGETVVVTEKIHGANGRFSWAKNKGVYDQFCGSRTNWMKEDDKNLWWMAFRQNPAIGEWCKANPDKIIYGEVFGQVQSLKYGAEKNDIFFAAFGILQGNQWLDYDVCQDLIRPFPNLKWAPLVYRGPFDLAKIAPLAEGDSQWPGANHMAEGVVVVPEHERTNEKIGRVVLKIVSNRYLEKG
jgi:RNA ligase (TIGR02306 family)